MALVFTDSKNPFLWKFYQEKLAPPFLIKNVESCENEISQCVEKGVGWRFPNEMGVGWRFPYRVFPFPLKYPKTTWLWTNQNEAWWKISQADFGLFTKWTNSRLNKNHVIITRCGFISSQGHRETERISREIMISRLLIARFFLSPKSLY